jgi:hypothetical protein
MYTSKKNDRTCIGISIFEGKLRSFDNSKLCDYCVKNFHKDMYLDNLDYCINCWSVMDTDNFDCEKMIYKSDTIKVDDVVKFISKYYKNYLDHGFNINREDCIFKKIFNAMNENKIHFILKKTLTGNAVVYKNLDEYRTYIKNRNPKINFDLTVISI